MNTATSIVADQIADEILRLKAAQSALDSILYLRTIVGDEFDTTFHAIMRRVGDKHKSKTTGGVQ